MIKKQLLIHAHLGNNIIRAIAMSSTDGLRGIEVIDTKALSKFLQVKTLGRIFNVLGEVVDRERTNKYRIKDSIHMTPKFEDLETHSEILRTGIKVVDLLAPYLKVVKLVFWWSGCRKNSFNTRINK